MEAVTVRPPLLLLERKRVRALILSDIKGERVSVERGFFPHHHHHHHSFGPRVSSLIKPSRSILSPGYLRYRGDKNEIRRLNPQK